MVDVARYFLTFIQSESCGKCTFCRIGTKRMLEILTRITEGKGEEKDIAELEELAAKVKVSSLCGLGQTAPNPVLTTLRYFRAEYDDHIRNKRCAAKKCKALIRFSVDRRGVHRVHAVRAGLPHQGGARGAEEGARHRPGHLHPVRAVLRGVPVRRDRDHHRGQPRHEKATPGTRWPWTRSRSPWTGRSSSSSRAGPSSTWRRARASASPPSATTGAWSPYASCWVCLVKVEKAKGFVPSCGTRVDPGHGHHHQRARGRTRRAAWRWTCSSPTTTGTARRPAPSPARRTSTSRATSASWPTGSSAEAVELIRRDNPMPAVIGRICPRPCEQKCRRNLVEEPLNINGIKRFVADVEAAAGGMPPRPVPAPHGKKVAVVGAGPAGLSAAWYLSEKGVEVTLLEAMEKAGGMLRYGIPDYRLPPAVLDRAIAEMLSMGADAAHRRAAGQGRDAGEASRGERRRGARHRRVEGPGPSHPR